MLERAVLGVVIVTVFAPLAVAAAICLLLRARPDASIADAAAGLAQILRRR